MPIDTISQTISTIPEAGRRGVDVQTQFVIKQEDFQDHLQGTTVSELNALKTQINTTVTGMNIAVENVNTKTSEASASASSASASSNTATTKAGEASASASSASASSTKAGQWADANYNVQVETGKYSAKHWSTVAQNVVTNKIDRVTSTDNAVVRFNGVTGEVQNSGVVIDDNGNVGIGGTPSAWISSSYTRAIEIGTATDNGTIWSSLNKNHSHIGIGANFYMDSSFTARYKDNYPASQYNQFVGSHHWQTAPSGTAGNAIAWTNAMTLDQSGNLLLTSGTGALGYGTGAGGVVTQLTSKSTTVTLNKPSGVIIMNAAALAGGTGATFQFNNSLLSSIDNLECTFYAMSLSNQGAYTLEKSISNGVAFITVTNRGASTFSDNIYINFSIIKGANS